MKRPLPSAKIACAILIAAATLLHAGNSSADEGVFDRETEIRSYLDVFANGNVTQASIAARTFAESGIGDPRVAQVLSQRLERDYPRLTPRHEQNAPYEVNHVLSNMPRVDWQYGVAMVRALASTGVYETADTLERVRRSPASGGSQVKQVRRESEKEKKRIEWYKTRNDIMSSKRNHHEGDDPRASMMINLLTSSDDSYRRYAMERIASERMRDPRPFAVVNEQLRRQMAEDAAGSAKGNEALLVWRIRLLGVSGDRGYRGTLSEIAAAKASLTAKKAAQTSLDQLK